MAIKHRQPKDDRRAPLGSWAPGDYHCICVRCEAEFCGDKRAAVCADCAYDSAPAYAPPALGLYRL